MDVNAYLDGVNHLAQKCLDRAIAPVILIGEPGLENEKLVNDCVEFRKCLLTMQDEDELRGYLEMGFFLGVSRQQRLATFALYSEVQNVYDLLEMKHQCVQYDRSQKLFVAEPSLFDDVRRREGSGSPDLELISLKALTAVSDSEVYKVRRGYGKLTHHLHPGIVNWAKKSFPDSPIFVRLDPHQYFEKAPLQSLMEATLIPARVCQA
jgi:hypothetical protein